jgi:hypothetical protein
VTRTWEHTTEEGDTLTLTVDDVGAAVSVRRVYGAREGWVLSHQELLDAWLPWLEAHFEGALDDVREALDAARGAADDVDDNIP